MINRYLILVDPIYLLALWTHTYWLWVTFRSSGRDTSSWRYISRSYPGSPRHGLPYCYITVHHETSKHSSLRMSWQSRLKRASSCMPAFAVYGLNSLIEKNKTVPTITVSGCDSSLFVPWCTLRWQNHSSLGWSASEVYGRGHVHINLRSIPVLAQSGCYASLPTHTHLTLHQ